MPFLRFLLPAVIALALGACSGAAFLNSVTADEAISQTRNVAYAPGEERTLDVYRPPNANAGARGAPVVVFIYGGSWQNGAKEDYRFVGTALAGRGFVTLIPDYRKYPEVRFPGFIEDAAKAVRWAKGNAARFGGDPDRMILMGHSAGAQIAALLALDEHYLRAVGLSPRRDLAGFVGLAGPYDFLPLRDAALKEVFANPAGLAPTQPINFADHPAPPTFLAAGRLDTTVDPGNTKRLAARMTQAGNVVETRLYAAATHETIVGALAKPLAFVAPVLDDVAAFIDARTGGARQEPRS